ncbi:MAG TPA: hypothetical protein IGS52_10585 [Oscillatoriaceae cyanobacterium M33_DOE_052]|nr:hypothetical protein [Oscillatoriaceae cyanobacterium M33_DOE_052]
MGRWGDGGILLPPLPPLPILPISGPPGPPPASVALQSRYEEISGVRSPKCLVGF